MRNHCRNFVNGQKIYVKVLWPTLTQDYAQEHVFKYIQVVLVKIKTPTPRRANHVVERKREYPKENTCLTVSRRVVCAPFLPQQRDDRLIKSGI